MSNRIIAVEGISYSGKTTLSQMLSQHSGVVRIYELAENHEFGAGFPPFPSNDSEAFSSDLWFFNQEVVRSQLAIEASKNSLVVLDRSYLSSQAFVKARNRCYGIGNPDHHADLIQYGLESGLLVEPEYIFIDIDMDTYKERVARYEQDRLNAFGPAAMNNRANNIKDAEFIDEMLSFYRDYFSKNRGFVLDGRRPTSENYSLLQRHLIDSGFHLEIGGSKNE
jgi:thymidylate kinase